MQLKANLKYLLVKHDITATKLSRLVQIPNATLSDWLSGSSPKNLVQVKKVANHFKVSIDDLVFGSVETFSKSESKSKIIEKYGDEIIAGEFLVILKPIKK